MTKIDRNGALHDNRGLYATQGCAAASYDLDPTWGSSVTLDSVEDNTPSSAHSVIVRDIAAKRQITDDVTSAVTDASLVTDMGDEMFFPKDSAEAFGPDCDNLVQWSDDPHRGRDFMEVRVGPHVMYIDPVIDETTGEIRYESPEGDWAFVSSNADEMAECVGDFLRSEVKDHPARRLEAFKAEGLASKEYGTTFDPETAALLMVRDKIDEATLPGTTVDDGTVDSPAGAWDDLNPDALTALRDAEDTAAYWKEQRLAIWARQNARRDAERKVVAAQRAVQRGEENVRWHAALAQGPIDPIYLAPGPDGSPGKNEYQVREDRKADLDAAQKALARAEESLVKAEAELSAQPKPFKQAYIDDVERGVVESGTALSKVKRSGDHGASRTEMDLGFTVDSNILTAEDVLEIRNAYAAQKRIAPESVRRDDLRSLAHDYALNEARRRQDGLRADMLTDELAQRGVPAVVATYKDDFSVPGEMQHATLTGTGWMGNASGWHRLSEKENTFVRFVDAYTEAAEVVQDVTSREVLRRRKAGEIISGQSFHGDGKRLALRGGTTWDVVDETSKVAVTGMGRGNTRAGYIDGAVDEGETSWVLDMAADDSSHSLF